MKRRQNREIMVFSISFLDVIASALGAILILFIVQYKKTVNARVEVVKSERRHVQCAQVLEWVYARENPLLSNEVVVSNRTTDTVQNTPYDKRGTATKPNSPNNNVITPKLRKEVTPEKKIKLVDKVTPSMRPVMRPRVTMSTPAAGAKPQVNSMKPGLDEKEPMGVTPAGEMRASVMQPAMDKPDTDSKGVTPGGERSKAVAMKAPARIKTVPDMGVTTKKEKSLLKLPPKPKRKALATCITTQSSVIVAFYDYDKPDGDTIMVTFNGRHATKLKLGKSPTKRFRFKLMENKYNIISIKNLSNGFYPVNTANVSISGCGRARWKMRDVGVTRVIYIYKK